MAKFIIIYHAGRKPNTPEEGAAHMQKWKDWISGMGAAVISPGQPLKSNKLLSSDGVSDVGDNVVSGYMVIEADDYDAAMEMAKGDPLRTLGTVQLAEMIQMG